MALDAVAVARAFEVMLPVHKASLTLTHNEHLDCYKTVEEELENIACGGDPVEFVSDVERQKAIATNELWVLHWYPETPVGFNRIAAATLPALAMWLQDNGLAFGS